LASRGVFEKSKKQKVGAGGASRATGPFFVLLFSLSIFQPPNLSAFF
jgi:hypothetical protein